MANLKKVLAGSLSLCLAASMFTACGSTDSSSTSDKNGGSTSKAGDGTGINKDADRVNTAELHGVDSSEDSKKTLTIYCWNTEFKSRLDKYYPQGTSNELTYNELTDGSKEIATINGVKLNWVQVENEGNAYQTKLDEALKGQQDSTEKVDMFLMEADYALKYANGDVALSIQDLGITDDDMSQMYQYTKDVATDTKTGELKGVSWQATPGLFLYNTKIAEDVLGTSDPEKVQEAVKDWDTFTATAQKMADKGYKMVSGFDDTYRCFSNNMTHRSRLGLTRLRNTQTRATTTRLPFGTMLGLLARRSTVAYSATSSQHGAFLSHFFQTQLTKRSRLMVQTLRKATAVMVSGRLAQAHRLTTGAVHGSAALSTPITRISLLIS